MTRVWAQGSVSFEDTVYLLGQGRSYVGHTEVLVSLSKVYWVQALDINAGGGHER